jgi:hypothetical protein
MYNSGMDIQFYDMNEAPLPAAEVRIRQLEARLLDERRLKVQLSLAPFQQRPNGDLELVNVEGDLLASASFIEAMMPRQEFTLHLRGEASFPLRLNVTLYYESEAAAGETPQRLVVDEKQIEISPG